MLPAEINIDYKSFTAIDTTWSFDQLTAMIHTLHLFLSVVLYLCVRVCARAPAEERNMNGISHQMNAWHATLAFSFSWKDL